MKSLFFKQTIGLLLSGALASYAITHAVFLLSWACYLPLFLLLNGKTVKEYFTSGLIFGLGVSVVFFSWMVNGAKEFSGNSILYGILVTACSTILFCIYWGGLLAFIGWLLKGKYNRNIVKALLVASCFVLAESLLSFCFNQLPYYLYNSGDGLLNNVYTIQWASYLGLPFLNFCVVFINYLVYQITVIKNWKVVLLPSGIVVLIMVSGFFIKQNIEHKVVLQKQLKIAIAAENIPPQLRWDEHGGNILAQRLLTLNTQAAQLKPDLVLWSESTIPWTYKADDDLLKEILKAPYPSQTTHIIGFMSEYNKNKVYNSTYGIKSNGEVIGRYDKQALLHFVETPTFGFNLPFLDLGSYLIEPGKITKPIATPFGKAGIAVCNEIVKPKATIEMVKNGAEFLLNPSNDAWFQDSYIVQMHFLYARLSAIINRKDVVLNSNNGISGSIKYNGEVLLKRKSNDFFVEMALVYPNNYDNSSNFFPSLMPLICLLIILYAFFLKVYRNKLLS